MLTYCVYAALFESRAPRLTARCPPFNRLSADIFELPGAVREAPGGFVLLFSPDFPQRHYFDIPLGAMSVMTPGRSADLFKALIKLLFRIN